VHIKVVLELPPRLSFNRWVSFESLKGMCGSPYPRARITLPRYERLWLIFLASSKIFPVAPVWLILSDPARSTKLSFAVLIDPSTFS